MRIIHFHRSLGTGGIEAMVCNLANEMAKTEDITVGTIFRPREDDLFYKQLSPEIHKIDLGKTDDTERPFKEIFKLCRVIRKGGYDIVHIHGYFYYYILAIFMLHRKVTFFYTLHNDAYKEGPAWDIKLLKLKKMFFRKRWMNPITISKVSQESFFKLYGCSSFMVSNGISAPTIDSSDNIINLNRMTPNTKVFVNAGRVHEQKNQLMLCRVFQRLIKDGRDVMLYIAGCIQDYGIFEQMKPLLSDRIIFLDQMDDIPSLLAKADGMCLSSNYEGLPVVLLEALSVGCVPICTPVGGIKDVIENGNNGILSLSVNEEDYYVAVSAFLDMSDSDIESLKNNCLKSFSMHSIAATSHGYLNCYNGLLCSN